MAFFVDDIEGAEPPWPKLGDRVLSGGSQMGAAHLAGLEADSSAIADGFLHAADMLAGDWLDGEAGRPYTCAAASVALPIIALYRHGLELTMKAMLSVYSELSEGEIAGFSHKLDKLWGACRAMLWPYDDTPGEDLLGVEEAVMDFHTFDPKNENLRYAFNRGGGVIVLREASVDIAQLRDRMRAVANFFDCADTELHVRTHGF